MHARQHAQFEDADEDEEPYRYDDDDDGYDDDEHPLFDGWRRLQAGQFWNGRRACNRLSEFRKKPREKRQVRDKIVALAAPCERQGDHLLAGSPESVCCNLMVALCKLFQCSTCGTILHDVQPFLQVTHGGQRRKPARNPSASLFKFRLSVRFSSRVLSKVAFNRHCTEFAVIRRVAPGMHSCLQISEILRGIARYVQTLQGYRGPMEMQWETLYGFEVLLKCFPEDVWNVSKDGAFVGPRKPPCRADWDRILALTKHVKTFYAQYNNMYKDYSTEYSNAALHFLSAHRPVLWLFPNLRYLIWDRDDICMDHASVLIGPLLETVVIVVDEGALFLVQALADNAPSLRELEVGEFSPPLSDVFKNCGHLFQSLTRLQCLDVYLSTDAIITLSTLPLLQTLWCSVDISGFLDRGELLSAHRPIFFPSLRDLRIDLESWQWTAAFLQACTRSPNIQNIEVFIKGRPLVAHIRHVSAALASHHTIENITVTTYAMEPELSGPDYVLSEADIAPLFACRNIRSLFLSEFACRFDDNTFLKMATAWPHLHSIDVGMCVGQRSLDKIPLKTLHTFASRCAQLDHVALPISFEHISQEDVQCFRSMPSPLLTKLSVDVTTPVSDMKLLTAFISVAFPQVTYLRSVQLMPNDTAKRMAVAARSLFGSVYSRRAAEVSDGLGERDPHNHHSVLFIPYDTQARVNMKPTAARLSDMPGPKVYNLWWGDRGVSPQKGIAQYSLSPMRQRAAKHMFSGWFFNGYRRLSQQAPYWVVPFAIGYGVYSWAKSFDQWQNSKAGHGHAGGH
ncbi:hypothetical protein NM688_g3194 [Phlebia brevispora]|uniref:Uncharacterized protein n=1 Tax=Phlebia brevispora TaxID=194682 RepID=A0ACC1T6B6_9APHY|nr:hypothetical protein NM688_g3194 [Phlebia brevispora]